MGAETGAHSWRPQPAGPVMGMPPPMPAADGPAVLPPIRAAEATVLLPKFVEVEEAEPPSPRELAERHGLVLAGTRPRLGEYTRQLWRYRQFIASYANGRLIASFGAARLGRLWQVLTPVVNAGVYYLIFGVVLNTRDQVPNFIGYLCTGLFIFTFTQGVVLAGVQSISGQLGLVRALQFPRASLPLAVTLTQFQSLVASIAVLVGIVLATGEQATTRWLWLVPTLALQSVFNVGLALVIARVGAKLPDVRQLVPYVMRTWMYASAVLYSVNVFGEHLPPTAVAILHANPLLVYIELARYSLLADPPLASSVPELWAMGGAWALVVCIVGYVYFWRGEAEYGRG